MTAILHLARPHPAHGPAPRRAPLVPRARLVGELQRLGAAAPASPLSVVCVDLGGCPNGESLGHPVAAVLAAEARSVDVAGRASATVFALVLQGAGAARAAASAARIAWQLRRILPCGEARVVTATGSGANAGVLLAAAMDGSP